MASYMENLENDIKRYQEEQERRRREEEARRRAAAERMAQERAAQEQLLRNETAARAIVNPGAPAEPKGALGNAMDTMRSRIDQMRAIALANSLMGGKTGATGKPAPSSGVKGNTAKAPEKKGPTLPEVNPARETPASRMRKANELLGANQLIVGEDGKLKRNPGVLMPNGVQWPAYKYSMERVTGRNPASFLLKQNDQADASQPFARAMNMARDWLSKNDLPASWEEMTPEQRRRVTGDTSQESIFAPMQRQWFEEEYSNWANSSQENREKDAANQIIGMVTSRSGMQNLLDFLKQGDELKGDPEKRSAGSGYDDVAVARANYDKTARKTGAYDGQEDADNGLLSDSALKKKAQDSSAEAKKANDLAGQMRRRVQEIIDKASQPGSEDTLTDEEKDLLVRLEGYEPDTEDEENLERQRFNAVYDAQRGLLGNWEQRENWYEPLAQANAAAEAAAKTAEEAEGELEGRRMTSEALAAIERGETAISPLANPVKPYEDLWDAMQNGQGAWDDRLLLSFILNPEIQQAGDVLLHHRPEEGQNDWLQQGLNLLDDDEKKAAEYYAGRGQLREYLDSIGPELKKRRREAMNMATANTATADVGSAVGSFILAQAAGLQSIGDSWMIGLNSLLGKEIPDYSTLYDMTATKQTIQGVQTEAAGDLAEKAGLPRAFGTITYGAIYSAAENVLRNMITGGADKLLGGAKIDGKTISEAANWLNLTLMGNQVFASSMYEHAQNNDSAERSILYALGDVGIEILTENLHIDEFFDSVMRGDTLWKNVLAEAGEELAGNPLKWVFDAVAGTLIGEESDFQRMFQEAKAANPDRSDADILKELWGGRLQEMAVDGLSGAFSTLISTAPVYAAGTANQNRIGADIRGVEGAQSQLMSIAESLNNSEINETLEKIKGGEKKTKLPRKRLLGQLYQQVYEQLDPEGRKTLDQHVFGEQVKADLRGSARKTKKGKLAAKEGRELTQEEISQAEGGDRTVYWTGIDGGDEFGGAATVERFDEANPNNVIIRDREGNEHSVKADDLTYEDAGVAAVVDALGSNGTEMDTEAKNTMLAAYNGGDSAEFVTKHLSAFRQGLTEGAMRPGEQNLTSGAEDGASAQKAQEAQRPGEQNLTSGAEDGTAEAVIRAAAENGDLTQEQAEDLIRQTQQQTQDQAAAGTTEGETSETEQTNPQAGGTAGAQHAATAEALIQAAAENGAITQAQATQLTNQLNLRRAEIRQEAQQAQQTRQEAQTQQLTGREAAGTAAAPAAQRYTGTQRMLYEAGQRAGQAREAQRLQTVEANRGRPGTGRVVFESSVKTNQLSREQRMQVNTLKRIGKVLGIDFSFFASQADETGQFTAEQGSYSLNTNSIRLDINAGRNKISDSMTKTAILRTAAHEITHFIEHNSGMGYGRLQTAVRAVMDANNGTGYFDQMVKNQMQRNRLTESDAMREVIADGCEMMLQDSEAVKRLVRENRNLAETIRDMIVERIVNPIREAFKGIRANSLEAQALMEADKYARDLQKLWDDALVEAVRNNRGEEITTETEEAAPQLTAKEQTEEQRAIDYVKGESDGVIDMPEQTTQESTRTWEEPELKKARGITRRYLEAHEGAVWEQRTLPNGKKEYYVSGREISRMAMMDAGWSKAKINRHLRFMDQAAAWMKEAGLKYRFIGMDDINSARLMYNHATGQITMSCKVANAEYPVNFDFTYICKKRQALQHYMDDLAARAGTSGGSMLSEMELTPANLQRINKYLSDSGYETACLGCFVEARRAHMKSHTEKFEGVWNDLVRQVQKERGGKVKDITWFRFAQEHNVLDSMSDAEISKLEEEMRKFKTYGTGSLEDKILRTLRAKPELLHYISADDIISSEGRTKMTELDPMLSSLVQASMGASAMKPAYGFIPYNSEIALLGNRTAKMPTLEYLKKIGGARSQSFSDFIITHYMDHLQKTLDYAAKGWTAHTYTKELARAMLFGMTGEKINLSVMFDVDNSVDWAHAGLDRDGNLLVSDWRHQARVRKSGNTDQTSYVQSIPYAEAVALENDPRYSKNVGVIGVGYSWNHILTMLNGNTVPYVIPYHRSGMPADIMTATHLDHATDYQNVQNTMKVTGYARVTNRDKGLGVPSYASWNIAKETEPYTGEIFDLQEALERTGDGQAAISEWLEWMDENDLSPVTEALKINGKEVTGHGSYDIYGELERTGSNTETASDYMAWCIQNGGVPLFYEFGAHENYHRMLFDFSTTDLVTGETAPQRPVDMEPLIRMGADEALHNGWALQDANGNPAMLYDADGSQVMDRDGNPKTARAKGVEGYMAEYDQYNEEQFAGEKYEQTLRAIHDLAEKKQFSAREPIEVREDGLVAVHNMKVNDLLEALKQGGLTWPSIAVRKARGNREGFGEFGNSSVFFRKEVITRINDYYSMNDNGIGKTRVYGTDAYTESLPSEILRQLQNGQETVRFRTPWGEWEEYPATVQGLHQAMESIHRINETQSGKWSVEDYGFAGLLATMAAKRYSSVEDIRADLNRLATREERNKDRDAVERKANQLAWDIWNARGNTSYGDLDDFTWAFKQKLGEVGKKTSNSDGSQAGWEWVDFDNTDNDAGYGLKDNPNLFTFNGEVVRMTGEEMQRISDLLEEARNIRTDFFEAKVRRAVTNDEIAAVLLPATMDEWFGGQEALDELKTMLDDLGIDVYEYDGTNEDRKAVMEEIPAYTEGVQFSKREPITRNGLKIGMSDGERYDRLKGTEIEVYDATGRISDLDLAEINKTRWKQASTVLAPIARKLGLISTRQNEGTKLKNKYLDFEAEFSKSSLDESVHGMQENYGALGLLMPVFKETYENAVPILVQGDRYANVVTEKGNVETFAYLLGAFKYEKKTIPVQFEVKKNTAERNNLYVVATIKEGAVMTNSQGGTNRQAIGSAPSEMSIADVIAGVNSEDTRILANLPWPFLNAEQLAGKRKGLKQKGKHLYDKATAKNRAKANDIVNVTEERIDEDIAYQGTPSPTSDYSNAYMTYIDPLDFVRLTAPSVENMENESRVWVNSEMRGDRTPFLKFDEESGVITDQEGRHRMMAMANAGVKRVAILMIPESRKNRYNRQTIESLAVTGKVINGAKAGGAATLTNLIPVNGKHRQELLDTFVNSENWTQYSQRDYGQMDAGDFVSAMEGDPGLKEAEAGVLRHYNDLKRQAAELQAKINATQQQMADEEARTAAQTGMGGESPAAGTGSTGSAGRGVSVTAAREGTDFRDAVAAMNADYEKAVGMSLAAKRNNLKTWQTQLDRLNERITKMESSEGMVGLMQRAHRAMAKLNSLAESGETAEGLKAGMELMRETLKAMQEGNREQARTLTRDFEKSYFTDKAKREVAVRLKNLTRTGMSIEELTERFGQLSAAYYAGSENTAGIWQDLVQDLLDPANKNYPAAEFGLAERIRTALGNKVKYTIPVNEAGARYIKERWGSIDNANREARKIHLEFARQKGSGWGADSAAAELAELVPGLINTDRHMAQEDIIDWVMEHSDESSINREEFLYQHGIENEQDQLYEVMNFIGTELTGLQQLSAQMQAGRLRSALQNQQAYIESMDAQMEALQEQMKDLFRGSGEEILRQMTRAGGDARTVMAYMGALNGENAESSRETIRALEATVRGYEQMVQDITGQAAASYANALKWHDNINENEKLHRSIQRFAKRLDRMTRRGTDLDHVPEELRGVTAAVMRMVAKFDAEHSHGQAMLAFSAKDAAQIAGEYARMGESSGYYDEEVLELLDAMRSSIEAYEQVRANGLRGADAAAAYNEALTNIRDSLEVLSGMVTAANKVFMAGKSEEIQQVAQKAGGEMLKRTNARSFDGAFRGLETAMELFGTGNMTPYYFFKRLGGVMRALHDELRRGQNKYGLRLDQAKAAIQGMKERYHYDSWANRDNDTLTLPTSSGRKETLTREEALYLRAVWNREHTGKQIETSHLENGGFVREDAKKTGIHRMTERTGLKVSEQAMESINNWLTDEQKAYGDAMVRYLSTTVGGWGNETSMQMYGYRKYREEHYFPFKVYRGNLKQGSNAGALGLGETATVNPHLIKSGFSKNLTAGARNSVVLGNFTDTALEHISGMLTYSTVAAPVEQLNRVLNAKVGTDEEAVLDGTGMVTGSEWNASAPQGITLRALFEQKYGRNMARYLATYLKDLNGGVQADSRERAFDRLLSLFKKGAVSGSLSVSFKQPVSFLRAAYEISPKYLAGAIAIPGTHLRDSYSEMRRYAGVGAIKEMGRYDTATGWTAAEWLGDRADEDSKLRQLWKGARESIGYDADNKKLSWETFKNRWDIIAGYLPGKMDELTWNRLWEAVKLEQAAKNPGMDTASEAFLRKCGERFTDVIDATQVYDSTMSRSQNMRSRSAMIKGITSFMAEPTVNLNMLADAVMSHSPKKLGTAAVIYILSAAAQALVTAHFGTIREDDEEKEKTYWEKLMDRLGAALGDEINPLGSIPGASDLYAMLQGESVSRNDLSVITDIVKYTDKLMQGKYAGDLHGIYMGMEQVGGSFAKLLGLPAKNLLRDMRAMVNWLDHGNGADRASSAPVMKLNLVNGWHEAWNSKAMTFYDTSGSAYVQRYYDALRAGRTEEAEDLLEYLTIGEGKKPDSIRTGLRKALKADLTAGKISLDEAIGFAMAQGMWDSEKAAYGDLVKAQAQAAQEEGEETETANAYTPLWQAMEAGPEAYRKAAGDMTAYGYSEKTIQSQTKGHIRDLYLAGTYTAKQAEKALGEYCGVSDKAELHWTMREWDYDRDKGANDPNFSKYGEIRQAVWDGDWTAFNKAKSELQTYNTAKDEKTNNTNIVTQGICCWKDEYRELRKTDRKAAEKLWTHIERALKAFGKSEKEISRKKNEWDKD